MTDLHILADDSILRLYDSIRAQASADIRLCGSYRFLGDAARRQAARLQAELDRRGMQYAPIVWGLNLV
jgi:hypothetical protein